ncbi:MAG TPA: heme-binding protein [Microbacteriaceae bacterium]|nr:heme-binding protein [Microbacteriaceae bacterium]
MTDELSGATAVRLDLRAARFVIDRAVAKAQEFQVRGTFAICDDAGTLISLSRMQGASAAGVRITRGKAALTAMHQERSDVLDRRLRDSPARFEAIRDLSPDLYPGAGAQFIKIDGRIVGAYASGSGYGPLKQIQGIDPSRLMADGQPANVEDLITAHALGIRYRDQHPQSNLVERSQGELHEWNVGEIAQTADERGVWAGFGERRPSLTLRTARALADAVLAAADRAVSVAICDEVGTPMQIDRMVDAPPMSVRRAEARARTAFAEGTDGEGALLVRSAEGRVLGSIGVVGAGVDAAPDRLERIVAAATR